MSVETAEAALTLAKAEQAWLDAKKSGKKDDKYLKAQAAVIAARDDWRTNHRESGPGTATPAPLNVSLEVK